MKTANLLLVGLFSVLAACSDGEEGAGPKSSTQEPLLKAQREVLEKAKGVSVLLQDAVDKQNLIIDEQAK